MEEIRTGDALESEIREDARRKAERILKQAEKDAESYRAGMAERLKEDLSRMEADSLRRSEKYREDVFSRQNLEKMRVRLAWVEGRLRSSLEAAVSAVTEKEASSILLSRFEGAVGEFEGLGARVRVAGIDMAEASAWFSGRLPDAVLERASGEDASSGAEGAWIEAVADGGRLRFRSSIASVFDEIADDERGSLAEALVGNLSRGSGPDPDRIEPGLSREDGR